MAKLLELKRFGWGVGRSFRLSMSVGGAYLRADAQAGLAELLEQADAAMYEQKNARRLAGGTSVRPPSALGR